jgi:hypothetical protein
MYLTFIPEPLLPVVLVQVLVRTSTLPSSLYLVRVLPVRTSTVSTARGIFVVRSYNVYETFFYLHIDSLLFTGGSCLMEL